MPRERDFTEDSYWYQPLPNNPPEYSNPAGSLQQLGSGTYNYLRMSMDSWAMPCYYPQAGDPIYHVVDGKSLSGASGYQNLSDLVKPGGPGLRMPGPGLNGNNEGAMLVIDRTYFTNNGQRGGNWIVAFHQHAANKSGDGTQNWTGTTYRADGGGLFFRATNGLDARVKNLYPNNTPPNPATPQNTGSMRGCPNNVRSGMRKEDVAAGRLDRIIEAFAPGTGASIAYPWVGHESGPNQHLPEGIRIRIRHTVDIDRLAGPVGSARWILARGLMEFGMAVGDQSGKTTVVKLEATKLLNRTGNDWDGTNMSVGCMSQLPFNNTVWQVVRPNYEPPITLSPPPPPPPPPPGGVPTIGTLSSSAQTSTSITLNWTAASATSTDPVTEYRVYQTGVSGTVATTGAAARTRTISNLQPSTAYSFELTAVNGAGESARSNTVTVSTSAVSPPPPPPGSAQWPGHKVGYIYLGTSEVPDRLTDATATEVGAPFGLEREYFINYNSATAEDTFITAAHSKNRIPWISFKVKQGTAAEMLADWQATAAGTNDTALRARASRYATFTKPIIVTYNAMPERDNTTSDGWTAWRAAWTHMYDLFASVGGTDNIAFVPIYADELWHTGTPLNWVNDAMLQRMPFLGLRSDKTTTNATWATRIPAVLAWLDGRGFTTKMVGIGQAAGYGSSGQTGAQWWATSFAWAKANTGRVGAIAYHNTNASPAPSGSYLISETPEKMAAFGASGNDTTTTNLLGPPSPPPPPPPPPPVTLPGPPTSLTVSAVGDGYVSLNWTAPDGSTGGPVSGFRVFQGTSTNTLLADVASPSATINGLTNGLAYTFTVRAYNELGNSAASGSVVGTPTGSVSPPPPPPLPRRFREGSWFEKPLPVNAPIHPQNSTWVADMMGSPGTYLRFTGGADYGNYGTSSDYTMPLYRVDASTPNYHLVSQTQFWVNPRFAAGGAGIRIPGAAKQFFSGTISSDSPCVIYDPLRGYYASLSKLRWEQGGTPGAATDADKTGRWVIQAGGSTGISFLSSYGITSGTSNVGQITQESWWPAKLRTDAGVGTGVAPSVYQDNTENFGYRGNNMMSRVVDLERLIAEQGLFYVTELFIHASANAGRWPMSGYEPNRGGIIPEGVRLRIKPDVDVAARLNADTATFGVAGARTAAQQQALREATWIAKGLQLFGMMVGDNAGGASRLKLESRYKEGLGVGWAVPQDGLKALPWTDWHFIADDYDPPLPGSPPPPPPPPPPPGPPGAPAGLQVEDEGNASVTVSWSEPPTPPGDPVTSYQVYSGTGTTTPLGAAVTTTTATITGLTNDQAYTLTVRASNTAGQSAASNTVTATPGAAPTDPPTAVTLTAAGDTTLALSWTGVAGTPTGYNVYISEDPTPQATVPGTTATITGLSLGTAYDVTVRAYNRVGEGPASTPVTMTTTGTVSPPPPPPPPPPDPDFPLWETDTVIPQSGPTPTAPSGLTAEGTVT